MRWLRGLRDPWTRSIVLAVGLVVIGIGALGVTAVALSDAVSVPEQVAFLVSGGFGGLALAGTGVALFDVQRSRRARAEERHDFAALAAEIAVVAEGIAARRMTSPSSRPATGRRRSRRVLRAR